jgi:GNAT superfamily N-acetyltransferase
LAREYRYSLSLTIRPHGHADEAPIGARCLTVSQIQVREGDPVADQHAVLSVLARNMPESASRERYRWLYLSNPVGPARVWLAEDARTGEAVGTSAAHRQEVRVGGKVHVALTLSDFAIDRRYRALGPALKLLRETLKPITSDQLLLAYEQSRDGMLPLYQRLGVRPIARFVTLSRPLRVSSLLERRWGQGLPTSVLGRLGDATLSVAASFPPPPRGIEIERLQSASPDDFARLEKDTAHHSFLRVVRSAAHVNWRLLGDPTFQHEVICARSSSGFEGYAAFHTPKPGRIWVTDFLARHGAVSCALLSHLIAVARARASNSMGVTVVEGSPTERLFRRAGFVFPRPLPTTLTLYAPDAPPALHRAMASARSWWFLYGDTVDVD